ncbi:MAG: hypothetical protein IPO65_12035 [Saprospiraceae bacterium]|nr:hypothetical protein [Saprospiraceae bacterium]
MLHCCWEKKEPTTQNASDGRIHPVAESFKARELDEQIRDLKEEVRDKAATVSMEYDFFFRGKFSHCGVNVFHFLKSETGWKLTGIDDTRNKTNCMGEQKAAAGLFVGFAGML